MPHGLAEGGAIFVADATRAVNAANTMAACASQCTTRHLSHSLLHAASQSRHVAEKRRWHDAEGRLDDRGLQLGGELPAQSGSH